MAPLFMSSPETIVFTSDEIELILNKRKVDAQIAERKRIEDKKYAEFTTNVLPSVISVLDNYKSRINELSHILVQADNEKRTLLDQYNTFKRNMRNVCLHKQHSDEAIYDNDDERGPLTFYFVCPYCDKHISCKRDGALIDKK